MVVLKRILVDRTGIFALRFESITDQLFSTMRRKVRQHDHIWYQLLQRIQSGISLALLAYREDAFKQAHVLQHNGLEVSAVTDQSSQA